MSEPEKLQVTIEKIREIHRPIRVYDECECDLKNDDDHEQIELLDYTACRKSFIGWACESCCYDDEYPLENCPHGAVHHDVLEEDSCPTNQALKGIKRTDQLDLGDSDD